jgi:ATP-dependent RNA helicase SUPV3L1/SUV3
MPAPSSPDAKVWAVLGPTNTGKTHLAVERMLAHPSGVIGLPLRLLAREVYDRAVRLKGAGHVALVTGEERITPPHARYVVATVEAMPTDRAASFVAVDEIQLCADPDRGHVFTDRLLRARGTGETMFLGADTMRPLARALVPRLHVERRERMSRLSHAGSSKITRLPKRSAIVAFSAEEVYAIAELIRRHRGGAAVVMGALSPRTRNAQVALYQSGEVDFLVATDAIGMGLNMDVDHVAFAGLSKFDGRRHRPLSAAEIGQIAGRAGRFKTDGTFGETADCPPMDAELIDQVEGHAFDAVDALQWRAAKLDFASPEPLLASLDVPPPHPALNRVRGALDEETLRRLLHDPWIAERAVGPARVARLWELAQLPDFRKSPIDEHVRLIAGLARHVLEPGGRAPADLFARRVAELDRVDGDIEQLQGRLSAIRTWTYVANRADWVVDPPHWRAQTRAIEDRLSDILHERLMQRFVDKRTSALLKGLKREDAMTVNVADDGAVTVEGQFLGRLTGLRFVADPDAAGLEERAVKNAAFQALRPELSRRLNAIAESDAAGFALTDAGAILWEGVEVARLSPRQPLLKPRAILSGGELGPEDARGRALEGLDAWLAAQVRADLGALVALRDAAEGLVPAAEAPSTDCAPEPVAETPAEPAPAPEPKAAPAPEAEAEPDAAPDGAPEAVPEIEAAPDAAPEAPPARRGRPKPAPAPAQPLKGLARGMAWRLAENGGVLSREGLEADLAALSQDDRRALRAVGVRFGRAGLYLPALLKPRAARLHALLDHHARGHDDPEGPFLPTPGATSVKLDRPVRPEQLAAAGYRAFGARAVRLDIVDRIADALFSAAEAAKGPCPFPLAVVSLLGATVEEAEGVAMALDWRKDVDAEGVALWRHQRPRPPRPPREARAPRGGERPPRDPAAPRPARPHGRGPRPDGAAPQAEGAPAARPQGERRPFDRKPGERHADRRGGDRPGPRGGDGRGRDRGPGQGRGGPRVLSAEPDRLAARFADSPFAALAALKVPPPPPTAATGEGKAKRKRPPRRKNRSDRPVDPAATTAPETAPETTPETTAPETAAPATPPPDGA